MKSEDGKTHRKNLIIMRSL